jgi:hypothetical protein
MSLKAQVEGNGASADVYWLGQFIRVNIRLKDLNVFISVYLFKLRIYRRPVRNILMVESRKKLIKAVEVSDVEIHLRYGINCPFRTAISCGAIAFFLTWLPVKVRRFTQNPDFTVGREYIYLVAYARINLRHTINNYLKMRRGNINGYKQSEFAS